MLKKATSRRAGLNQRIATLIRTNGSIMSASSDGVMFHGNQVGNGSGPDDIAFIMKNLESAASENTFFVLDKDGGYKVVYMYWLNLLWICQSLPVISNLMLKGVFGSQPSKWYAQ